VSSEETDDSPRSAWTEIRAAPFLVKAWLLGYAAIYLTAKIHTWSTMGSPGFVGRHWPFWAALLAWPALLAVGWGVHAALASWRKSRPVAGGESVVRKDPEDRP
jgi:hypothetical protein